MRSNALPAQIARTRRFTLGVPAQFTVTQGETAVLFLRSRAGDDPARLIGTAGGGALRLIEAVHHPGGSLSNILSSPEGIKVPPVIPRRRRRRARLVEPQPAPRPGRALGALERRPAHPVAVHPPDHRLPERRRKPLGPPVDAVPWPNGALYVSDDTANAIYRFTP